MSCRAAGPATVLSRSMRRATSRFRHRAAPAARPIRLPGRARPRLPPPTLKLASNSSLAGGNPFLSIALEAVPASTAISMPPRRLIAAIPPSPRSTPPPPNVAGIATSDPEARRTLCGGVAVIAISAVAFPRPPAVCRPLLEASAVVKAAVSLLGPRPLSLAAGWRTSRPLDADPPFARSARTRGMAGRDEAVRALLWTRSASSPARDREGLCPSRRQQSRLGHPDIVHDFASPGRRRADDAASLWPRRPPRRPRAGTPVRANLAATVASSRRLAPSPGSAIRPRPLYRRPRRLSDVMVFDHAGANARCAVQCATRASTMRSGRARPIAPG